MCGRYTITDSPRQLAERFRASLPGMDFGPRYNAAPTQLLPVVIELGGRRIELMRWGLIPSWAKDAAIGNRLINARAETVAGKPSFRSAFKSRRCLVPADGFYEWLKAPGGKRPMRVMARGGRVFAIAGLWERWGGPRDDTKSTQSTGAADEPVAAGAKRAVDLPGAAEPAAGEVHSFTIITVDAVLSIRDIHDRMPLILTPAQEEIWLDPKAEPEALSAVLAGCIAEPPTAYEVSSRVNSPRNDDAGLIEPDRPSDGGLF
jgi:putative SOS response-associated peptidase YedK